MMWTRIATAAVLIPIVAVLVLWGSTAILSLGVALIMVLALLEFFALGDAIGHRAYRFWTCACALLLVYLQWRATIASSYELSGGLTLQRREAGFAPHLEFAFFVFVLGVAALTLWTKRPLVEGLPAAGISSSGLLLVAFPWSYAVRLHGMVGEGRLLLLFALVVTWVGDSAAYFVGRAVGKHALAPHLSPKKTWEGTAASFVSAFVVAVVFRRWLNAPFAHLLAIAAVANIAGQIGDLLESAYKRSAGVKDSGGLLPGHGGVLDRIDALILAIPVVWYYWILVYSPRNAAF